MVLLRVHVLHGGVVVRHRGVVRHRADGRRLVKGALKVGHLLALLRVNVKALKLRHHIAVHRVLRVHVLRVCVCGVMVVVVQQFGRHAAVHKLGHHCHWHGRAKVRHLGVRCRVHPTHHRAAHHCAANAHHAAVKRARRRRLGEFTHRLQLWIAT